MHNAAPAGLGGKAALGRGFLGPVREHPGICGVLLTRAGRRVLLVAQRQY